MADQPDLGGEGADRIGDAAAPPLLDVRGLIVDLGARPPRRVVNGVSLHIQRGECLGLVGESGSGKTTVGRAILRLIEPTAGSVMFDGVDVLAARGAALRALRRRMQIVFQDPAGSLNPRLRIGAAIAEPIEVHGLARGAAAVRARVAELLAQVGLEPAAAARYPHEFSGGQRQRIAIARALATGPDLLVCDEPTSALDVSVQAQVLNLLCELRARLGLSLLFISHDMAVIRHMCERVMVMKDAAIVEEGARDDVLSRPGHAYTRELLEAVPRVQGA